MPASETATGGGESNRRLFGLIRRLWGSTAPQPAGDGPTASAGRTGDYPPFPVFPAVRGYVLVDELGRGGMGVVYRALDLGTGRTVALKAVYPVGAGAAAVRARFEREVRALARIKHPNIVPVYHAGEGPGFPFFTMEYVPGGTLQKHLDRVRADLGGAVRLVAKVARAVERLHAAGVWHRDLKPLNILLGDGDEPLVADFGLAKFRGDESDMTQSGAVLGTRHYMSPEQTRGQTHSYSPACDIWAVGVILYELLTGRRPFAAADPVELYRLIREEAPESCSATNPGVPPALDAIARRCMAKRPEDRYRTAAEVAAALERWLADGTGPAPAPEAAPPRASGLAALPAVGRRRWGRWAAAAAGLAVVAATAALLASAPIGEWLIRIDQRRIVRDLQAGRTVEVVGPDGMPRFRWAAVPGSTERFAPDRDGCATLSATAYGGVDLVTVPLPIPVRVEAEVAVLDRRPDGWVAVHVGGLEVGPPRGPGRSQIQFTLSEAAGPGGAAAVVVRTKGSVDALWRPVEGTIAPSTWHSLTRERVEPGPQPAPPHFHPIAIELLPGGVTFLWDRDVAAHLTEADIRGAVEPSDRRHGAPRSTAPVLGPGIGLSAVACTAAVRNVRLVPRFVPATEGRARE